MDFLEPGNKSSIYASAEVFERYSLSLSSFFFFRIIDLFEDHGDGVECFTREQTSSCLMQFALIADAIETSKKKLDGTMKAASTVVESSDENVRSIAVTI